MSSWLWGVGTSRFGKQPSTTAAELAWQATLEALRDAGVTQVDAVYVGTCFGEPGIAQRCLSRMGVTRVPIVTIESACASSSVALHEARWAIESGRFGCVLVLGVEHLTSRFTGAIPVELRDVEGRSGLALPALYAMAANRYMDQYGLTLEQLAQVSVKNHHNGSRNARAGYGIAVGLDEVLTSKMIADPLTLLQCCGISDAAAAAILGSCRRGSRDICLRTTAFETGDLWDVSSKHVWGYQLTSDVAKSAYENAGIGPDDVDLFEVHDAFTIGEIVATEALGMTTEGSGGELLSVGATSLSGRRPVNPSGGLLSRGHPLGATGIAQIAEAVWQLRSDASGRQVANARVAVVETAGGGVAGIDGNACVVGVLSAT